MIAIQQELPFALVEGKPITDIPHDLYIPPDALAVFLDTFEGPLDLLLYLIRRQNMDILQINVAEITEQYMDYINLAETMRFELAADYLLMAATLAEIKSRTLLPKSEVQQDEDDPRAELIRRLQEYERFKKAAEDIDALPRMQRDSYGVQVEREVLSHQKAHPDVSLEDLLLALHEVLQRSDMFESHQVAREKLSTRERMSRILSVLEADGFTPFQALFVAHEGRSGVVVTFLALLELIKSNLVELVQVEVFGAIHVRARGSLAMA